MRVLRLAGFGLWLLTLLPAVAADTPLSLSQYLDQLQQLRSSVKSAADASATDQLVDKLPSVWHVSAAGRVFEVPTDVVARPLRAYAEQHTPARLADVNAQLDLLASNAQEMETTKVDAMQARTKLNEILSRHEFRNIKGETWWDRLKAAVQRWLLQLLSRIFSSSAFPVLGRIVIWILVAAAVAVAALWVVRNYRQGNVYPTFTGSPDAVSAKPWRDWQTDAQAAAREGRWRDAVHLSYWAAISFLEGQGLWRPDHARTPREYLRLLASGDTHRDPLLQLTRTFEAVWYGTDSATAETFAGASAQLERLGCR